MGILACWKVDAEEKNADIEFSEAGGLNCVLVSGDDQDRRQIVGAWSSGALGKAR